MSLDIMKQALEALDGLSEPYDILRAQDALRAAIKEAQGDGVCRHCSGAGCVACDARHLPEQEPVAWMNPSWIDPDTRGWASDSFESIQIEGWIPLYTAPRQWQGLTDAEIKAPIQKAMQHFGYDPTQYSLGGMATIGFLGLVKEIEAKLKEKNT